MAMIYSAIASPVYCRGVYSRVLRSAGDSLPDLDGDNMELSKWKGLEVVKLKYMYMTRIIGVQDLFIMSLNNKRIR